MTLSSSDLEHYTGERGRRGNKLPRGLQRVDSVEIEMTASSVVSEEVNEKDDSAD